MEKQGTEVSRVVLITGCSSGLGRATAIHLANKGWTVYATARRVTDLAETTAAGCRALALDVTDEASMVAAVQAIEAEHGAIGVLINNAGYSQSGAIEAVPMARVRAQFETNVFGLLRLTQLVLPKMRAQRWGRIVNLSSMGGKLVFPGGGYYHATKYAVEALSDALRFEVRGFGIEVVIVEPGLIKSGFAEAATSSMKLEGELAGAYDKFHAAVAKGTTEVYEKGPFARLAGVPEDVAKTIAKAISARRPRTRYTVSPSAKVFLAQRALLSDRAWDWMMTFNMPSPGAE
jgi:NAD(P)-dependent dehydrogenase (short-subunit alcohol dehydrogenase family)